MTAMQINPYSNTQLAQLIIRGIGLIYLIAFISLFYQLPGIIGPDGLAVAAKTLKLYPFTLLWLNDSNIFIQILCLLGVVFSSLMLLGVHKTWISLCTWILFTSICAVGLSYFHYIWDLLLMEMGFCTILLTCLRTDSKYVLLFIQFLVFRLFFMMGYVKLVSDDPSWQNLLFVKNYLLNQPMPNRISWWLYQLPDLFHQIFAIITLVVECLIPFFIFIPKKLTAFRKAIFYILTLFMLGLFFSGNYGYFQFLVIVMCLAILNDLDLKTFPVLKKIKPREKFYGPQNLRAKKIIIYPAMIFLSLIGSFWIVNMVTRPPQASFCDVTWTFKKTHPVLPDLFIKATRLALMAKLSFPYDLFSHLPKNRHDVVVQGSNDNENWKNYEFIYKPSSETQIAGNYAPFQSRIDHQIFYLGLVQAFAANPIDKIDRSALAFFARRLSVQDLPQKLLEGNQAVLNLLKENPFPEAPPKFVRLQLVKQEFTNVDELKSTGRWWRNEVVRILD